MIKVIKSGIRFFGPMYFIAVYSLIFSSTAIALPITYTVTYDPSSLETTYSNAISSEASLLTYATVGNSVLVENWIAQGESITYYADGTFMGTNGTKSHYINRPFKDLHVKSPTEDKWDGQEYRKLSTTDWKKLVKSVTLEKGKCYEIRWKKGTGYAIVGDDIWGLPDEDGSIYLQLGDSERYPWFFAAGQASVEVAYGAVMIGTDTDNFFSAFSPHSAAGCPIPEPTTMLFLGSGLIALAGFRKKFKK